MKNITILFALAVLLTACNSRQNDALIKKSSSGKTLEVLLAADQGHFLQSTRALIDSIFHEPQGCLPQPEPRFDVVKLPVSSLHNTQMFKMHRNIVQLEVKKGNPDKMYVSYNLWAEPQMVAVVSASCEDSLCALLRRHEPRIVKDIYANEHQRMINAFYNYRNVELMKRVKDKFGFSLTLSEDFMWASEDGDFAWIRKETKDVSLGVLVNVTPYRDASQFSPAKIYNRLDTIMRRHVPGPSGVSYMATERRVEMETEAVEYPGVDYCIQTHGLWHLLGDADRMGGPFVHYSILSPDGKDVVDIIGFVYAPRFDKRDYLMQVEGICFSAKWD